MLHAEMTGEVSRSMLVARDEKIERIVAIVDGLAIRGDADALIAPLRMRLARMRMRRPLKFARLLFTPLDALVVPTALWSRGRLGLPRAALAPIAAECRVLLGAALGPVDALIEGCDTDNIVALRAAGRLLWPLAARALAGLAAPADWVRTSGLAVEDHDDAVRLLTGVLREAAEIEELVARAGDGVMPDARQLRPLVARVAAAGDPRGVAAVLAVLLARLPDAERVLNAAGELAATSQDKGGGTAADAAIDIMLGAIRPAGIQLLDLAGAADQLRAAAALLNGVERIGAGHRPARRTRSMEIRAALQTSCRARYTRDVRASVLQPLAAGSEPSDDAAQHAIERTARDLRRFEHASRLLGGEADDTMVSEVADTLRTGVGPAVDRARVAEILLGADRAATLLAELV